MAGKDWTGNASFRNTNNRKPEAEVSPDDFYVTHPDSVRAFLDAIAGDSYFQLGNCWEPACGTGNISRVLAAHEIHTYSTDKVDRGYGNQFDFLKDTMDLGEVGGIDTIITNPPYKYAKEFVLKALSYNVRYVIMYVKLTFLEGKERFEMFKHNPPWRVYIHSSRQGCSPNGEWEFKNGGAAAYCWVIWQTGILPSLRHAPAIYWIAPNS